MIIDSKYQGLKILVVDDFSTMRRVIRKLLNNIGFSHIDEASDGRKALSMLQNGYYDIVLTDWNMPEMTGIDLVRSIREDSRLRNLPVVMVTAESKREQIIQAAQTGINGYIVKPFTAETLYDKISKVLARLEK